VLPRIDQSILTLETPDHLGFFNGPRTDAVEAETNRDFG
jgi:hypothetical protein